MNLAIGCSVRAELLPRYRKKLVRKRDSSFTDTSPSPRGMFRLSRTAKFLLEAVIKFENQS